MKLTKKYETDDPLARPIVTAYLTSMEYAALAVLPADVVTKRRYKIDGFSLDQFEGALAGLELVERECPDDDSLKALAPPSWAGREVTEDKAFQGGTLAVLGLPIGQ